ncbi:response regulator transcription factor [Geodermatophilus sp. DSM 44513]|uniref:response regulator transcription factor n=1 Tax=Geodermatophilus sp. DSM 44513 TaxID=1528104 RepID=UPI00126EC295|nr:response regulator transcription factor [Geodermatophilus sp. DSM 44513]WNV76019.1 response regulator transcription factor [Geodermatophilus sp. DSM 44513]
MSCILIAEDEVRIASFVDHGLRSSGFATRVVHTGTEAHAQARTGRYDLMVLDIGLPDVDGLTVLRRLREAQVGLPVIVLTARDSVTDRVAGLRGGADDYLGKPFAFEELLARVHLRLRPDRPDQPLEPSVLQVGDAVLDLGTRRVTLDGREIALSAREFALAQTFWRHPDQVLSKGQLLSSVWGLDLDPDSNVVEVYVRYLRRKIGADRIETVRGLGYRLRAGAPEDGAAAGR